MQLNIRSNEAYQFASKLAELTGQSRTAAVTDVLRTKVAELERKQDAAGREKRILAIAAEMRAEILRLGYSLDDLSTDSPCDCFAYALAKVTGEPLLFKGNEFSQTDVQSALAV